MLIWGPRVLYNMVPEYLSHLLSCHCLPLSPELSPFRFKKIINWSSHGGCCACCPHAEIALPPDSGCCPSLGLIGTPKGGLPWALCPERFSHQLFIPTGSTFSLTRIGICNCLTYLFSDLSSVSSFTNSLKGKILCVFFIPINPALCIVKVTQ